MAWLLFLLVPVLVIDIGFAQVSRQDIEVFQKQLLQNPNDPDLNYNMAQAYFLLGNTDQTIRYLERTLSLSPGDAMVMLKLASVYRKIGHLADARTLLLRAVDIAPEEADFWYELGVVYSDLANYEAGIKAFQKALHSSRSEDQKFLIIYYTGLLHLSNRDWGNYQDCLRRLRPEPKYYDELKKLGHFWRKD